MHGSIEWPTRTYIFQPMHALLLRYLLNLISDMPTTYMTDYHPSYLRTWKHDGRRKDPSSSPIVPYRAYRCLDAQPKRFARFTSPNQLERYRFLSSNALLEELDQTDISNFISVSLIRPYELKLPVKNLIARND